MQTITRKLEFDAGHRIPDHRSQCRNLHGHRYVLEITLQGELVETEGAPDRGMVMDFADVKALAMEHLVNKWDHAFIVYAGDEVVRSFLEKMADHKTVVLDRIPTVENLAAEAFRILSERLQRPLRRRSEVASACVCTKRRIAGRTSKASDALTGLQGALLPALFCHGMIFGQAARFVAAHSSDIAYWSETCLPAIPPRADLPGTTR